MLGRQHLLIGPWRNFRFTAVVQILGRPPYVPDTCNPIGRSPSPIEFDLFVVHPSYNRPMPNHHASSFPLVALNTCTMFRHYVSISAEHFLKVMASHPSGTLYGPVQYFYEKSVSFSGVGSGLPELSNTTLDIAVNVNWLWLLHCNNVFLIIQDREVFSTTFGKE